MIPAISLGAVKRVLLSPKVMVGILFAALVAGNVYFKLRLDSVKSTNKLLDYRVETLLDANKANGKTIEELQEANDDLLARIEMDAAAAAEAAREAELQRARLLAERERIQRELRDALSTSPTCEDLAALDLSALCPEFVERLLRFYERSRQN